MKPKYQIGDKVWVIQNNKVTKGIITGIAIDKTFSFDGSGTHYITYSLDFGNGGDHRESVLYPTKESLIASL